MLGAPFCSLDVSTHCGRTLRVETCGSGDPVLLFVHGFAEGAYVWRDSMLALAPNATRAALDLRGHGASTWQPDGRYVMAGMQDDVEAVLDALGARRCALVGHSLGGNVALRVAARNFDRVCAVVVVDTQASPNAVATEQVRRGLQETVERRWTLDAYVDWLAERRPLAPPAAVAYLARQSLRACEDGSLLPRLDPRLSDFEKSDGSLWRVLAHVRQPVLLLRGAYSGVLSDAAARAMVACMPDACLRSVAQAGHGVMIDNPSGFVDAVREFFVDRGILDADEADLPPASDDAGVPHFMVEHCAETQAQ